MQTNKRTIVIFHNKTDMDENVESLLTDFTDKHLSDKIYVFTESEQDKFNVVKNGIAIQNINWTTECNSIPKQKNFINAYLKLQQTTGFVHVISDNIKFQKDPTQFLDELEHMMKAFDYPLWLNTVTDPCNYIYKKYNPRLIIGIDKDEYKAGFGNNLIYTSHSNDNWMCYDFDSIDDRLLKFDEDFTIAMYYIIELLARRKALRKELQPMFMNQYMTVESEKGTFTTIDSNVQIEDNQSIMQTEEQLFKSKNIDYTSDNNIDEVLEKTLEIFRLKKQNI